MPEDADEYFAVTRIRRGSPGEDNLEQLDALLELAAVVESEPSTGSCSTRASALWVGTTDDGSNDSYLGWRPDESLVTDELRGELRRRGLGPGALANASPISFVEACALRPPVAWFALPVSLRGDGPVHLLWLIEAENDAAFARVRAWLLDQEHRADRPCILSEPDNATREILGLERSGSMPKRHLVLASNTLFSSTLAPFELGRQPVVGATVQPFYPLLDSQTSPRIDRATSDQLASPVYVAWGWTLPAADRSRWVTAWLQSMRLKSSSDSGKPSDKPGSRSPCLVGGGSVRRLPGDWEHYQFCPIQDTTLIELQPRPRLMHAEIGRLQPPASISRVAVKLAADNQRHTNADQPYVAAAIRQLQMQDAVIRRQVLQLRMLSADAVEKPTQVLGWDDATAGHEVQRMLLTEPSQVLGALRYAFVHAGPGGAPGLHLVSSRFKYVPGAHSRGDGGRFDRSLIDVIEGEYRPTLTWYFEPSWLEAPHRLNVAIPRGRALQPNLVPWRAPSAAIAAFFQSPDATKPIDGHPEVDQLESNSERLARIFGEVRDTSGIVVLVQTHQAESSSSAADLLLLPEGAWMDMTDSPASPIWQHFAAANQPQWAESARATAASAMSELRAALDAELRGSLESMAQVSAQLNTVVDDFQAAYRGVRVAIARAIAGEEEACDALAQSLQRTVARYSATHADLTMLLEIIRTETAGLLTTATQRERQIVGELNTTIAQWLAWQSGFVRRQHDYFERLVGRASGVEPALRYELIRQLREVADQLEVADPEAGSP